MKSVLVYDYLNNDNEFVYFGHLFVAMFIFLCVSL